MLLSTVIIVGESSDMRGLYLDCDTSVDTGHIDGMRLTIGQVALVHIDSKGRLQASEVIPHL